MQFSLRSIFLAFVMVGSALGAFGPCGLAVGLLVVAAAVFIPPRSIGEMLVAVVIIGILITLLLPATQSARERARRWECPNNLKQIAIALLNYEAECGSLPPAYVTGPDGKPWHSWRVLILPYLERMDLYKAYDFNEPWDGPNNSRLAGAMPRAYVCPSADEAWRARQNTTYAAVVGPRTMWPGAKPRRVQEVTAGTSHTILVVELGGKGIPWMEPRDLAFDELTGPEGRDPEQNPLGPHRGESGWFVVREGGGATNVAMADGSVHCIAWNVPGEPLAAVLTVNGREMADIDNLPAPSNGHIETNFPLTSLTCQSFTIEFTGTHNNAAQVWSPLIGQSGGCCFFFGKPDYQAGLGQAQLHVNFNGLAGFDSHVVPIADGKTHQFAVVFDDAANTLTMYFDNNPVGYAANVTGTLNAAAVGNLWMGAVAHNPSSEQWNGYADSVRISNTALARDQLAGAAAPPPMQAAFIVANAFNSAPGLVPGGGPRENALAVSTNRVVDKWNNDGGFDTYNTAGTDFAGLIYPGKAILDTVTVHMGNQFGDGGNWSAPPTLYLLTRLIDTGSTLPETSPHWVAVPGAVRINPGTFDAAVDPTPTPNSPITFDLRGLPLASRVAYGWAVGGVPGDGSNSFISVTEMEFSAQFSERLTPLVAPTNIVANSFNSAPGAGGRAGALAVSTDNVIYDDGGGGRGWDTFGTTGTDFAGLLYGQQVRMDRLMVYLGNQFGDGGAWSAEPKVYILKSNVDTATTRPEDNPAIWQQVGATLLSYNVFDAAVDVPGGGQLSQYSLVAFDLTGLPLDQRTGYGWAIGGVPGDGAQTFVSIAEMRAFMVDAVWVPEPATWTLLGLGGLGMALARRTLRRRR